MIRRLALVLALAAAPAHAQPPSADPIGDLLRDAPEEPDEAAERGGPVPPEPVLRPAPPSAAPPPPRITRPVHVDETGRTPEGPPSVADLAYESRLRASSASAQGFQGPLDGGWTLAAAEGELIAFQLVDRNGAVEGAWRDLRRKGALDASGFIDQVERVGGDVTFRFAAGAKVAVLRAGDDGRWTGELIEAGRSRAVSLRRSNP